MDYSWNGYSQGQQQQQQTSSSNTSSTLQQDPAPSYNPSYGNLTGSAVPQFSYPAFHSSQTPIPGLPTPTNQVSYNIAIRSDILAQVRQEYQAKQIEETERIEREKKERERRIEIQKDIELKERERRKRENIKIKYIHQLTKGVRELPVDIQGKIDKQDIVQVANHLLDRVIFAQIVDMRRKQATKERALKAERDKLIGRGDDVLIAKDKEIIRTLDQLVSEQQQELSLIGMSVFNITNDPSRIRVQMALLGVAAQLMEGGFDN